jgi:OOP family OmpA-OmpF porin
VESLDWREDGRPVVGLSADYAYKPLVLYGRNPADQSIVEERVVIARHHLLGHLGGGLNVGRDIRIGLDLPVVFYGAGETGKVGLVTYLPPQTSAVGDLRLAGDWRLVGSSKDAFRLALGVKAFLPTGDPRAYAGDGKFRANAQLQAAGEWGPVSIAGRVGVSYRALETAFAEGSVGTEATAALAAGVRFMENRLIVGPELTAATRIGQQFFTGVGTPVDLLVGGHYDLNSQWRVGAAVGRGFTPAFGEPSVRGVLSLEWVPAVAETGDRDGDGIGDALDMCPEVKGMASCNKASFGCPVGDLDNDGLNDDVDACPEVAEDRDGFEDADGCADPDNDKDGILDGGDQCRDVPETKNGVQDEDGCPDRDTSNDRDGDGIADDLDACSFEKGIASAEAAKNGCPSEDRDNDTVKNPEDTCPDSAGLTGLDRYINGCPAGAVVNGRLVLEKIEFETDKDLIRSDSEKILAKLLESINTLPATNRYRIEGHTDSRGGRFHNIDLSRRRARSVVKWLVAHGLDARRFDSEGFGPDRPVSDNDTAVGMQANRRVEVHIQKGTLETGEKASK